MAYQYANYMAQPTNTERLEMARKFLGELAALVGPDVAKDGASRSGASLNQAMEQVRNDIKWLQTQADTKRAGGVSLVRFG